MQAERQPTAPPEMPPAPMTQLGAVDYSPRRMVRLPFRVKVYDEKCREFETPPLWLEFPEPPNEGGWDWLAAVESEAKAILIADLECRVEWDEHRQSDVSDQRPGDRDATKNTNSGIAGFAPE